MATRKQRRRRAKDQRHDYEVVYLDSEGNEVEPEPAEPGAAAKTPARAPGSKRPAAKSSRLIREPKPPSWPRAARRGAIFMPILIAVVVLTNRRNTTPLGIILVAIVFTALVIPFGYFTDHLAWRAYQKRVATRPAKR